LLVIAGLAHFAIHWKWVTKVTRKVLSPKIKPGYEKQLPA